MRYKVENSLDASEFVLEAGGHWSGSSIPSHLLSRTAKGLGDQVIEDGIVVCAEVTREAAVYLEADRDG